MDDRRFDDTRSIACQRAQPPHGAQGAPRSGRISRNGRRSAHGQAARRPTTPTPVPRCPGNQTWNGSACICPGTLSKCGPACCNESVPVAMPRIASAATTPVAMASVTARSFAARRGKWSVTAIVARRARSASRERVSDARFAVTRVAAEPPRNAAGTARPRSALPANPLAALTTPFATRSTTAMERRPTVSTVSIPSAPRPYKTARATIPARPTDAIPASASSNTLQAVARRTPNARRSIRALPPTVSGTTPAMRCPTASRTNTVAAGTARPH